MAGRMPITSQVLQVHLRPGFLARPSIAGGLILVPRDRASRTTEVHSYSNLCRRCRRSLPCPAESALSGHVVVQHVVAARGGRANGSSSGAMRRHELGSSVFFWFFFKPRRSKTNSGAQPTSGVAASPDDYLVVHCTTSQYGYPRSSPSLPKPPSTSL